MHICPVNIFPKAISNGRNHLCVCGPSHYEFTRIGQAISFPVLADSLNLSFLLCHHSSRPSLRLFIPCLLDIQLLFNIFSGPRLIEPYPRQFSRLILYLFPPPSSDAPSLSQSTIVKIMQLLFSDMPGR